MQLISFHFCLLLRGLCSEITQCRSKLAPCTQHNTQGVRNRAPVFTTNQPFAAAAAAAAVPLSAVVLAARVSVLTRGVLQKNNDMHIHVYRMQHFIDGLLQCKQPNYSFFFFFTVICVRK